MDFTDIQDESQQLLNRITSRYQTTNINRNLWDIGNASKELSDTTSTKSVMGGSQFDNQSKVMNKYNIDNKLMVESLANLSNTTFSSNIQTEPTDINGFLNATFEAISMQAIQDIQKMTKKEFNHSLERSSQNEWVREKKKLEETLGQRIVRVTRNATSNTSSALDQSLSSQPSLYSSQAGGKRSVLFNSQQQQQQQPLEMMGFDERTRLSNKMRGYAGVIHQYLVNREEYKNVTGGTANSVSMEDYEDSFGIAKRLMQEHLNETTDYRKVVEDAWLLVSTLTGENKEILNGLKAVKQQSMEVQLVKRSIKFLEYQFCNTIKSKLPLRSNVSSTLEQLISYVSSNVQKPPIDYPDEEYRSCSIWSLIYYSIRSGYWDVAVTLSNSLSNRFKDLIGSILPLKIKDDAYPSELKNRLSQEYRMIRNESKDYYKIAVFNLMSGSDPTNVHSNKLLFPFIQDLIWWRLQFIKDAANYSLSMLQNALSDTLSQSSFDPYVLFQLHLLSGQYELGITKLYESSNGMNAPDALHMAIVMQRRGYILHVPRPEQIIVDAGPSDIYDSRTNTLNLVGMLRRYIKSFASETDTQEALDYYLLIEDTQVRVYCIADLIVSATRDTKFSRSLVQRVSKVEWRSIIEQSAIAYEQRQDIPGAIDYWLLLDQYARVLELFNTRFSTLLTATPSDEARQLYQFGSQLYRSRTLEVRTSSSSSSSTSPSQDNQYAYRTFEQLLQLAAFFEHYHASRYVETLAAIDAIGIVPVFENDVDARIEGYRFLSPHITRNFASIIQAIIDSIIKLYELAVANLNSQSFYIPPTSAATSLLGGPQKTIEDLQHRAQALTLFADKIDFPMAGATLSKLVNFMIRMKQ